MMCVLLRKLSLKMSFLLRKLSLKMPYLLLASRLGENKWESCGSEAVAVSQARQTTAVILFSVCYVFKCPITRARQQAFHIHFGRGVLEKGCILLCHSGISLPLLVFIILYKIEVTGGKRVVAPASRKAACVAESDKAHNATAAPGFLGAELRFGWQNRCSLCRSGVAGAALAAGVI